MTETPDKPKLPRAVLKRPIVFKPNGTIVIKLAPDGEPLYEFRPGLTEKNRPIILLYRVGYPGDTDKGTLLMSIDVNLLPDLMRLLPIVGTAARRMAVRATRSQQQQT